MNRVFVISDTHFSHKNIMKFEPLARPFVTVEEHDAELVRRWNAVVKPKDTVWHLGDVLFGKNFKVLEHLNGIKNLVLGNHDRYPIEEYFNRVVGCVEIRRCILTHLPVHPSQLNRRYRLNIHGHLHSYTIDDSRYINVSAERTGLAPVLLDSLL
jgi:calcineurin-like phosphoesterase family protein